MNRNTLPLTLIARSPHGKCSVASGLAMACSRSRASAASRPAPDDGPRFDGFAAAFFAAVFGGFAAVFGGFAVVFFAAGLAGFAARRVRAMSEVLVGRGVLELGVIAQVTG